jgi:4-hydroxy-4-methyl-2-oxoglutarate aldolase
MTNRITQLTKEELAEIQRLDTPTISNVLEPLEIRPWTEGFCGPEIRCMFPDFGTMVGYAVTLEMGARDKSDGVPRDQYWQAVLEVPEPRIIVVHDRDYPYPIGSFWGEVQANIGLGLGAVGCVTDGGVRDLLETQALGFHFFAKDVLVSHAYGHVEKVGGTVEIGGNPRHHGLKITNGDLIVGDRHGVIQVPHDVARRLPELAQRTADRESIIIETAQRDNVTVKALKEASARMQAFGRGDIH